MIFRAQELCENGCGRPGLPVLISLMVSVDVKQHCNVWSCTHAAGHRSETACCVLCERSDRAAFVSRSDRDRTAERRPANRKYQSGPTSFCPAIAICIGGEVSQQHGDGLGSFEVRGMP